MTTDLRAGIMASGEAAAIMANSAVCLWLLFKGVDSEEG